MFKLFYLFLTTSLLGSYKKQTILKPKLLFLNSLKFKPPQSTVLNFFSLILVFLLFATSCNTTNPIIEMELKLELKDISCTEAWLQLTTNNLPLPATINLLKNNTVAKVFNLSTNDSLFYIDSLLPNQTYKIIAAMQQYSNITSLKSNELSITTMDTTSHNFTWQTFEFGEHSSSVLYDVAIIDENNIWAVGEIYMNDSLGNPDIQIYNAIHWNGQSWELKRIQTLFRGNLITVPLEGIFAFSSTDIWMVGSLPIHGDGTSWNIYDVRTTVDPNLSLSKAWGVGSKDIYLVGRSGSIVHYQNGIWTKIESGTTTNINDIWGTIDPINYQQTIYGAVSFVYESGDRKILKIQNNKVDTIHWNTDRRVHSIWTLNNRYIYAVGGGIFENKKGYWNEVTEVPLYYSRNIRGTDNNNIFVCGDFGFFVHFNGTSWKTFNELYMQGIYYSLAIKNNIVTTVGFNGSKAVIIKGTRN